MTLCSDRYRASQEIHPLINLLYLLGSNSDGLELVELGARDLHPVKHLRLAPRNVPGSAIALLDALGALVERS